MKFIIDRTVVKTFDQFVLIEARNPEEAERLALEYDVSGAKVLTDDQVEVEVVSDLSVMPIEAALPKIEARVRQVIKHKPFADQTIRTIRRRLHLPPE